MKLRMNHLSPIKALVSRASSSLGSLVSLAMFFAACCAADAAPGLSTGNTTNLAGSTVTVPFSFTGATNVVALQFDVTLDGAVLGSGAAVAGAATGMHSINSTSLSNSARRVVVYSITNAFLQNGEVVNVPISISALALESTTGLTISNAILADINGQTVQPVTLTPGSIHISTALPARLGSVLRAPNGQAQFSVVGGNQRSYLIQASTNLTQWTSISTNTTSSGLINFFDSNASNYPIRFYRAIVAP